MSILLTALFLLLSHTVNSQTCTPLPNKYDVKDLAKASQVVIVAKVVKLVDIQGKGSKMMYNVTASVDTVFSLKNGGLVKKNKIKIGLFGKKNGCIPVKKGKKALFFLEETAESNFFWNTNNPITKKYKKDKKTLKKLLVIFAKDTAKVTFTKEKKLKLKCKPKKKPSPYDFTWVFEKTQLSNNANLSVKSNAKSSTLTFKSIDLVTAGKYVCMAYSKKLKLIGNFTFNVDVHRHANCGRCPASKDGFCMNGGTCCSSSSGSVHCLCPARFTGIRCEHRSDPREVSNQEQHRHQQKLIAVMGLCLALIAVIIICFSVYCLFKKKRSKVQHMLFNGLSNGPRSQPDVGSYQPAQPLMSDFPLDRTGSNFEAKASQPNLSNSNNVPNDGSQAHASDLSSTGAVLDEARLPSHPSTSSFNGKRDRLPGLSKSGPHRASGTRRESRNSSNHLPHSSHSAFSHNSVMGTAEAGGSRSSLHHSHQPQFPLDDGLGSIVKHQAESMLSDSASNLLDHVDGPVRAASASHQSPRTHPTNSLTSVGSFRNHQVTTFDPQGNIQHEHLGRNEGPLSAVTPHSPVSPTELSPAFSQRRTSHVGSISVPNGQFSPSMIDSVPKHVPHHSEYQQPPHQYQSVSSSDDLPNMSSLSRPPTDSEDLFSGVEIPDTSLGLYNSSSQHKSTSKYNPEEDLNSDVFHYSEEVLAAQRRNASVVSAQLSERPLLLKEMRDTSDLNRHVSESTTSLASESQSDSSTDNMDSPSIEV